MSAEITHTEKGQDRREQILSASLHLFAERGIEATGLRDIARAVGITQPTLYHYFASKDDLIDALFAAQGERAAAIQGEAMARVLESPSLRAGLRRLAEHLVQNWNSPDNRAFQRVVLSEVAQASPVGKRAYRMFIKPRQEMARQLFAALIDAGKVRDMDPDHLTLQFMGPIIFASMLRMGSDDFELDDERLREFVFQHLETLVRGIERG